MIVNGILAEFWIESDSKPISYLNKSWKISFSLFQSTISSFTILPLLYKHLQPDLRPPKLIHHKIRLQCSSTASISTAIWSAIDRPQPKYLSCRRRRCRHRRSHWKPFTPFCQKPSTSSPSSHPFFNLYIKAKTFIGLIYIAPGNKKPSFFWSSQAYRCGAMVGLIALF